MGAIAVPEGLNRTQLIFLGVVAIGAIVLMAEVYRGWSNGELDAFMNGSHDCKEGLPPSRGILYENENECEAYYEGYWGALNRNKIAAVAAVVTGLGALGAWLSRDSKK